MPIDFPNSPTNGDLYSAGGKNWQYNGSAWVLLGVSTTVAPADDSVTTAKIASGAVTAVKLAATAAIQPTIVDAKGDLIVGTANDTVARQAVGANGTVLMADSAQTNGVAWSEQSLGYRNVVINGAMRVHQRGTSKTAISTSIAIHTADRFNSFNDQLGIWTQTVENDAPTGSGFRKSAKWLCTTADASPAAGDRLIYFQDFEGQNLQQFLKGTASAKQFTLSFWVKSTTTGTYICELYDNDNIRSVSASYSIVAANTWEKKTITFPADTTGAFDNDNLNSFSLIWWLGAGTTFTSGTLATTWGSLVNANRAVGQTNLAAATNNYWQITGVQFEAGSVATPFEFEDYSTTLAKCQRYYQRLENTGGNTLYGESGWAVSTTRTFIAVKGVVSFRANPSVSESGLSVYDTATRDVTSIQFYAGDTTFSVITLDMINEAGSAANTLRTLSFLTNARIELSAEL